MFNVAKKPDLSHAKILSAPLYKQVYLHTIPIFYRITAAKPDLVTKALEQTVSLRIT